METKRREILVLIKPERFKSSIYLEKFKRIEKNEMQAQKEMKGKVSTPGGEMRENVRWAVLYSGIRGRLV